LIQKKTGFRMSRQQEAGTTCGPYSEPKAYYPASSCDDTCGDAPLGTHLVSVLDLDNICSFQIGRHPAGLERPGQMLAPKGTKLRYLRTCRYQTELILISLYTMSIRLKNRRSNSHSAA
jgi:hypothetical protein